ncbi:hypothetical protein L596_004944 [Steinernema carpocapsae]|nr:hypothetical protein L596_004944 [Steinernema carpocapsae]
MKVLDNWKINDSAVASQFETSEMVLMIDQRPLIVKSPEGPRLFVGTTQRIREALDDFGLVVSIRNSVLLDALPDEGDKCKALFGCSVLTLEPPHDSRISADEPRKRLAGVLGASLIPLRLAMLTMPMEQDRNWVARMQSLTKWSKIYNYCPKCSSLLRMRQSKSGASCGQCNRIYYPTVSPVAICLIRDKENEHCLLVRHLASMNGIFTTVAGFAEAGESLEEAVRREIAEEVGIECEDVRYMGMSQAWPMPNSSLMSAFSAVASRTDEKLISFHDSLSPPTSSTTPGGSAANRYSKPSAARSAIVE